ncbi:hypothetical protein QN277_016305 [Acacia crassicarpa]|uniref:Uncharacterized protein n=1 Tax=Acacia crassicarpa TaxID=499986 RepID=A0AAE1TAD0_9FABA|nr:hypothetical protein QN277_016305 [Acacia crassicarpa]
MKVTHQTNSHPNSGDSHDDDADDDDNGHDIEERDDIDKEDDSEHIIEVDDVPEHGEETPNVDAGRAVELFEHIVVPEHVKEHVQEEVTEQEIELRRSQRVINPSSVLKSPWIDPQRKSKGKRTYDEKDILYEMCTKFVSEAEAEEEFVDMHRYYLTRRDLQCLDARSWIGDRVHDV